MIDGLAQDSSNSIANALELLQQCWKYPQVRQSEADNFGGLGTFCYFFFDFMFMIWDSRLEDLQLFLLNFQHCTAVLH